VGFAGFWLVLDEAHLADIAVRTAYRRMGLGELLVISIIELAMKLNANVVTLEVRASNLAAQSLYQKYGFTETGMRRGYYIEDGEDALIMATESITSAPYKASFQRLKQAYAERWGEDRVPYLS
jgi:ribosomal-protein-alanine N-acetyltransferase